MSKDGTDNRTSEAALMIPSAKLVCPKAPRSRTRPHLSRRSSWVRMYELSRCPERNRYCPSDWSGRLRDRSIHELDAERPSDAEVFFSLGRRAARA
jgi:hypothetical protein